MHANSGEFPFLIDVGRFHHIQSFEPFASLSRPTDFSLGCTSLYKLHKHRQENCENTDVVLGALHVPKVTLCAVPGARVKQSNFESLRLIVSESRTDAYVRLCEDLPSWRFRNTCVGTPNQ
jgi:hypothetical protein